MLLCTNFFMFVLNIVNQHKFVNSYNNKINIKKKVKYQPDNENE